MKNLFIGGPVDGAWLETGGQEYHVVATMPKVPPKYNEGYPSPERINPERYTRVLFTAGGGAAEVYIAESLTKGMKDRQDMSERALHALLAGYSQQKREETERRESPPLPYETSSGDRLLTTPSPSQRGLANDPTAFKRALLAEMYGDGKASPPTPEFVEPQPYQKSGTELMMEGTMTKAEIIQMMREAEAAYNQARAKKLLEQEGLPQKSKTGYDYGKENGTPKSPKQSKKAKWQ